jgi:hypothetical protein
MAEEWKRIAKTKQSERQQWRRVFENLLNDQRKKYELGCHMAQKVLLKLTNRVRVDDGNRTGGRLNFDGELEKYGRVLECRAFTDKGLKVLNDELDVFANKQKKKREDELEGRIEIDRFHDKKVEENGSVGLEGLPVLSGFLDKLKDGMSWKKKIYTDVSYFRTPDRAKNLEQAELHFDVQDLEATGGEEERPLVLYFPTKPQDVYLQCKEVQKSSKRGRPAKARKFKVPARSILIFDAQRWGHTNYAWKSGEKRPPRRLNVLLHSRDEIQQVK